MRALARIRNGTTADWIVSANTRTWTHLPPTSRGAVSIADAIAAVRRLPREWSSAEGFEIDPGRLVTPAWRPGKVIGIAANYTEHATEVGLAPSTELRLFAKFPSSISGPNSAITARSSMTTALDYEAELAVVIGDHIPVGGRRRNPTDAVFGYAVANDVSARDIQSVGNQLTYAKSFDTFLPIGPWITLHTGGFRKLGTRTIQSRVNGELRQDARLDQMVRDVPTLIRDITRAISLEPGDIILTGSPAGSGIGLTPPRYLQNGDTVTCSIEGLGQITNRVWIHAGTANPNRAAANGDHPFRTLSTIPK